MGRPFFRRDMLLGGGPKFNGNPYSFYSLLDIFSDDRAAGAVNGTFPVVGGARTATDTNSKLSIAGGVASFATGGVGAGDPGLWYGSQARVSGKTLLERITPANTSSAVTGGWDANGSGSITDAVYFTTVPDLRVIVSSVTLVVGAYTATTYDIALVMRSTGMYYFIKGGAFTNWTLLWQSAALSSAALPAVVVHAGTNAIFTADNIRVPIPLYLIPYAAYDTFTRANGALGSSEAVGADGQAGTGRAWTVQAGTIVIASNAASLTVLGGGLNAIATLDAGVADVMVDVNVTRTVLSGGSVIRFTDTNNYLRASHDGTNALLEQVVAGTPTTLRTGAATYSAGATLRVIVSGTTGWLFYNGAAVGASFTVPSSSATLHGLYGLDTNVLWDNFQTMSRGVDGAYAGLDAM